MRARVCVRACGCACVWLCACVIDAQAVESRSVRRANCWSDPAALPPAVAARNTQRADCNIQCSMQHTMQHATCNAACNIQHAKRAVRPPTRRAGSHERVRANIRGRARVRAGTAGACARHCMVRAGREYIRAHELRELRGDAYQQRRRRLGPPQQRQKKLRIPEIEIASAGACVPICGCARACVRACARMPMTAPVGERVGSGPEGCAARAARQGVETDRCADADELTKSRAMNCSLMSLQSALQSIMIRCNRSYLLATSDH